MLSLSRHSSLGQESCFQSFCSPHLHTPRPCGAPPPKTGLTFPIKRYLWKQESSHLCFLGQIGVQMATEPWARDAVPQGAGCPCRVFLMVTSTCATAALGLWAHATLLGWFPVRHGMPQNLLGYGALENLLKLNTVSPQKRTCVHAYVCIHTHVHTLNLHTTAGGSGSSCSRAPRSSDPRLRTAELCHSKR